MMKHEFEALAGYEVSFDDYNKIIEPMYIAVDVDKTEFVKMIDRSRFELKKEKTADQIALEDQINSSIDEYKATIEFLKREIKVKESILQVEDDPAWIKTWKSDIKRYKEDIKIYKNRIESLKWVLA